MVGYMIGSRTIQITCDRCGHFMLLITEQRNIKQDMIYEAPPCARCIRDVEDYLLDQYINSKNIVEAYERKENITKE